MSRRQYANYWAWRGSGPLLWIERRHLPVLFMAGMASVKRRGGWR